MAWWGVFVLAVAVSLDGVGVGLAFGLARVRLPLPSLLLIGIASGGAVLGSMALGAVASSFLSPVLAARVGGGILLGFGLFLLGQYLGRGRNLVQLLDEPSRADLDQSGSIGLGEGLLLGGALAMDAFGAGFGAALAGLPPLVTGAAVAGAKVLLVGGSYWLAGGISLRAKAGWIRLLPGMLLAVLGLVKILAV